MYLCLFPPPSLFMQEVDTRLAASKFLVDNFMDLKYLHFNLSQLISLIVSAVLGSSWWIFVANIIARFFRSRNDLTS